MNKQSQHHSQGASSSNPEARESKVSRGRGSSCRGHRRRNKEAKSGEACDAPGVRRTNPVELSAPERRALQDLLSKILGRMMRSEGVQFNHEKCNIFLKFGRRLYVYLHFKFEKFFIWLNEGGEDETFTFFGNNDDIATKVSELGVEKLSAMLAQHALSEGKIKVKYDAGDCDAYRDLVRTLSAHVLRTSINPEKFVVEEVEL